MSFCFYSKEFSSNAFTFVENKFITQYLPAADPFAVKAYIYGLYLCQNAHIDFSISALARTLGCDEEKLKAAFKFWEDYDLLSVVSNDPFTVEYLPVATALGKSRRINYNSYADFNKELLTKMQRVNKYTTRQESQKYMEFMQENDMDPQTFLLIVEYCINKSGEKVTSSYILNKAKKLIRENITTYDQVEKELAGFNMHEKDLEDVFEALGGKQRRAEEGDYSLYEKWLTEYGFTPAAILYAAEMIKRGDLKALDGQLLSLKAKGVVGEKDVKSYAEKRRSIYETTFNVARKLSVKINSPETYADEYVSVWIEEGYGEKSLCDIAVYCTKISANTFVEMDGVIEELSAQNIISDESVSSFLSGRNAQMKILLKVKEVCSQVKITSASLTRVKTWLDLGFSDKMILEAARRSSSSGNPLPYMNKILSDWKEKGFSTVEDINETKPTPAAYSPATNPSIKALDDRSLRERFYADRRRKAQALADKYIKKAETNPEYVKVSSDIAAAKIELAKATVFGGKSAEAVERKLDVLREKQRGLLSAMGIDEEQLLPRPICKKCSDTGFLPNGKACDCYKSGE